MRHKIEIWTFEEKSFSVKDQSNQNGEIFEKVLNFSMFCVTFTDTKY
jgi:hypothetical protein